MPRIAVTSDLHFDVHEHLTPPEKVRTLVGAMVHSGADALVIAGDIGHPLRNFVGALDMFTRCGLPVGVVAGNHDVWQDEGHDSGDLWDEILPSASRARGFSWLERDTIVLGSTAIVGSMVWYDYSAAEPTLGLDDEFFANAKSKISNDALWIDWDRSDIELAGELRDGLARRLEAIERDSSIDRVLVVTHVPVFEQQMLRNPANYQWSVANAYFGNLRTGNVISQYPKVRTVVSGHLHASLRASIPRKRMSDIQALVIGSDYGEPTWVVVDM